MRKFACDFETNTHEDNVSVWAFGCCEIGNPDNFIYGNNINDFIKWCKTKHENYLLYFHNLKFDGEFIFHYLLSNGYTFIKDKKDKKDKTFTCLISDTGQFYSIEIYFDTKNKTRCNKVTIYDSLKILNFSVDQIAKNFNLPIRKLEIDYNIIRDEKHVLTKEEIDYIRNDVEIMARALDIMFKQNLTKMTIASNALSFYKELNPNFDKYFPILNYHLDQDLRYSYKGGFTYLNPIYKNKDVKNGLVLDVNSLYPSVMYNEKLPIGEPVFFKGEYKQDKLYSLYIQRISCSFKLKKNKIPTIQIKGNLSFVPNEYLESSNGDIVSLTLTNVDLELFFEHYDVEFLIYHCGWKFKGINGLFNKYINYWSENKIQAKKDGNSSLYLIAKLMLNSLYGKFGLNPNVRGKYPYLDNEIVKYHMLDKEIRDSIYIPVASFITSYARRKTITTSQKIKEYSINKYGKDLYIYSDTDSIHTLLTNEEELKKIVDIDDYRLGAWKIESRFTKAKFVRQKCYIEEFEDKLNVTVAGLPKKLGSLVTFKNFKQGFTCEGKLSFKHVKGGVLLAPTTFTIK